MRPLRADRRDLSIARAITRVNEVALCARGRAAEDGIAPSRHAAFERFPDLRLVEIFADEYELAVAFLILGPEAIPEQREAVVHAVENRAARISGDAEEALAPVDLLFLRHLLDEELELLDDHRLLEGE